MVGDVDERALQPCGAGLFGIVGRLPLLNGLWYKCIATHGVSITISLDRFYTVDEVGSVPAS